MWYSGGMKRLPKELWKYFWDVKAEELDIEKWPKHVIPRLMDYGDTAAVRWMQIEYGDDLIRDTLKTMRGISRPSAYYWSKLLGVNKEEVKCLQKPYRLIPYGV